MVIATKFGLSMPRQGQALAGLTAGRSRSSGVEHRSSGSRVGGNKSLLPAPSSPHMPSKTWPAVKDLIQKARSSTSACPNRCRTSAAHAVQPVTALQASTDLVAGHRKVHLAYLRELGIGLVPYSPLGRLPDRQDHENATADLPISAAATRASRRRRSGRIGR